MQKLLNCSCFYGLILITANITISVLLKIFGKVNATYIPKYSQEEVSSMHLEYTMSQIIYETVNNLEDSSLVVFLYCNKHLSLENTVNILFNTNFNNSYKIKPLAYLWDIKKEENLTIWLHHVFSELSYILMK